MKFNFTNLFFIFCWLVIPKAVKAQHAINISFKQDGNNLLIRYELNDIPSNVRLWIMPGLKIGNAPTNFSAMKSISGDVGLIQSYEGQKEIIWESYKDISEGLPSNISFEIKIKKTLINPNFSAISIAGNSLAPLGLKYSRLGLNGFYLSFKTLNFSFQKVKGNSNELENGKLTPELPFIYDEAIRQSFCINAGYIKAIMPHLYGYVGAGVGYDRTLWKAVELDNNLNKTNNEYWIEAYEDKYTGNPLLLLETGINYQLNKILFDAGVGATNSKKFYFNFGIGVALFKKQF